MTNTSHWQPCATIENLRKRAIFIQKIRDFFAQRRVLEVETPAMSHATVTDIHLHPFQTLWQRSPHDRGTPLYLMTSPEYHMKRLLAANSGSIFQLCRCFRNEEIGQHHNPEFTMLEWYRTGFSMQQLIDEVSLLLQTILNCAKPRQQTYREAFLHFLALDPFCADRQTLIDATQTFYLEKNAANSMERDELLQFLFAFGIEPQIGKQAPEIITHFPASQAVLARLDENDSQCALRFEFYFRGLELANGFEELTDAHEQRARFDADNQRRKNRNLPVHPIDENLLDAINSGLPACSGVALGVDRLLMLALGTSSIADVLAFSAERA